MFETYCCNRKKQTTSGSSKASVKLSREYFEITVEELKKIMGFRQKDAIEIIEQKYGGVLGISKKLKVDFDKGLSSIEDINLRRKVFGNNKLNMNTSKSFLTLVLNALKEKTLIMLEICALISFVMSFYHPPRKSTKDLDYNPYDDQENSYGFIEALAIMLSVGISVSVMALSEHNKESKFRDLQNRLEKEHKINVLRNRAIQEISTIDLVVGDICIIKYGDVIPVDGILFKCNELKIDESSVTGESDLVAKNFQTDITLYSGTNVMEGSGRMIVVGVGENSQTGVIFMLMKSSNEKKSLLQKNLGDLAVNIGYFGVSVAIITLAMLVFRSSIVNFLVKKEKFSYRHFKEYFNHFIISITILVVAIPEGLPLAVALSLAFSIKEMMKDNNLVRHLDACETMGNATTICLDKTGTLTANQMTAVQCYVCGVYYQNLSDRVLSLPSEVAILFSQNIALNSAKTSRLEKDENNQMKQYGNKTECALLGFLYKMKIDYSQIRQNFSEKNSVKVFSFNSTRKLMRTINKLPNGKGFRLLAKGASEIILRNCIYLVGHNGTILKLTQPEKNKIINQVIKVMALNGLRTICLAYLDYLFESDSNIVTPPLNCKIIKPNEEPDWENESTYSDMTCLAIIGIEDPVRKDVPLSIDKCKKAGITVRMITGDNIHTAKSIASKCGIVNFSNLSDPNEILESKDFNRLIRNEKGEIDQNLFDKVWPNLRVLARSTPIDKYILVKHMIASKLMPVREVVAVTGDGTNDAPALKIADVGFSMGIAGTEVTKEASDIILTDDNFASIVKAVIWGRNVYDNITKFIQFQLTVNIVSVLICFISALLIQESPLRPVQMLWINLITDTLVSFSLSTEKPNTNLLLRKPYGRNKPLISNNLIKIIISNGLYQLSILLILLFYGPELFDFDSAIQMPVRTPSVHFTMLFNVFVMMIFFNELNSRKINGERNVIKDIHSNWIFTSMFLINLLLQFLIVQFGGLLFFTSPLSIAQWLWCIAFGISMLIWGQIGICIIFRNNDHDWINALGTLFSSFGKNRQTNQSGTITD